MSVCVSERDCVHLHDRAKLHFYLDLKIKSEKMTRGNKHYQILTRHLFVIIVQRRERNKEIERDRQDRQTDRHIVVVSRVYIDTDKEIERERIRSK